MKKKQQPDRTIIYVVLGILAVIAAILVVPKLIENPAPEAPEANNTTRMYNGFRFEKVGEAWQSSILITDRRTNSSRQINIMFHYSPDEVENISTVSTLEGEPLVPNMLIKADVIYITTEPDYPSTVILSGVEISKTLSAIYGKEVKGALTVETAPNTPVKTCNDSTPVERVVYLTLANQTGIFVEGECVVIKGTTPKEVVMAGEKLTFELLKIL